MTRGDDSLGDIMEAPAWEKALPRDPRALLPMGVAIALMRARWEQSWTLVLCDFAERPFPSL